MPRGTQSRKSYMIRTELKHTLSSPSHLSTLLTRLIPLRPCLALSYPCHCSGLLSPTWCHILPYPSAFLLHPKLSLRTAHCPPCTSHHPTGHWRHPSRPYAPPVCSAYTPVLYRRSKVGPVIGGVLYDSVPDPSWAFRMPFLACSAAPLVLLPSVPYFMPSVSIGEEEVRQKCGDRVGWACRGGDGSAGLCVV